MATRLIDLPFTRGIDQSVDETSLAPPGMTELVNYRMTRQGRLEHRLGVLDQTVDDVVVDGAGDGLDTGKSQAIHGRHLMAGGHGYTCTDDGTWTNKGSVSRFVPSGSFPAAQASSQRYSSPSCAYTSNGYLVTVGYVALLSDVLVRVFDEAGGLVFSRTIGSEPVVMARVVACGTKAVVVMSLATDTIISLYLDTAVLPFAFAPVVETVSLATQTGGFDAAPYDTTSFLLSYYDTTDAVLAIVSATTLLELDSVGVSDDVGTKLTTCLTLSATRVFLAWRNNASDDICAAVFDETLTQIGSVLTLGSAPGTTLSTDVFHPVLGPRNASTVVVGWTDSYESGDYSTFRTTFADVTDAAGIGDIETIYGYYLASKIFGGESAFFGDSPQPAVWLGNHNPNTTDLDRSYYLMTLGFWTSDVLNAGCAWEMSASPSMATGAYRAGLGELNMGATRQVSEVVAASNGEWITVLQEAYRGLGTGNLHTRLQVYRYGDGAVSLRARTRQIVSCQGEFAVLGGAPRWHDTARLIELGMPHSAQVISATPGTGGVLASDGSYRYIFLLEYFDAAGQRQLSYAPSPVTVVLGPSDNAVTFELLVPAMWAFRNTENAATEFVTERGRGIVLRAYRTSNNGTVYRYCPEASNPNGITAGPLMDYGRVTYVDQNSDSDISVNEAVYVQVGNNLSNYRAPPCTFGCEHEGRLIVGGGWKRAEFYASKLIFAGEGVQFTESAAFTVGPLPEDGTGCASIDGSLILFTARGIYSVSGDGPTDDGLGAFPRPRRLPGRVGCVDWRSIVTTEAGVFFRSLDGLYLLPRGLGAPVYVGSAIRDRLRQFPESLGATVVTRALATTVSNADSEQIVCWLVGDSETPTSVTTMVYSVASGTWCETRLPEDVTNFQNVIGQWRNIVSSTDVVAWARTVIYAADVGSLIVENPTTGYDQDISGSYEPLLAGWLKTGKVFPFGFGGRGTVKAVRLVGDCLHATTIAPTVYSDANAAGYTGTVLTLAAGRFAVDLPLRQRDLAWLQIKITDPTTGDANRGAGLRFNGIAIEVEMEPGIHRTATASRST